MKVHGGAVHDAPPGLEVPAGFVVTEDDYIGFLSESSVENLVPTQLLTKLRDSHFLFLGYGVREWSLRVFLRRMWHEGEPGATSWAVQAGPTRWTMTYGAHSRSSATTCHRPTT
jgi:SIR2-like domain